MARNFNFLIAIINLGLVFFIALQLPKLYSISSRVRIEPSCFQLRGRISDQPWKELSIRIVRVRKVILHQLRRGNEELERAGQSLCIYEPYYGEENWPLLHSSSLYRGLGLSTKGHRRPEFDDIDAPSRLLLLGDPYYRHVLGDYGGFFAIANQVDRIHKHPWIGFQSLRATARKGDTVMLYSSGVPMDMDPRTTLLRRQDFWSFCDAINAGNCQYAFSKAMKEMYGINLQNLSLVPPMPTDGGTWSVMHSWALPTRSFLEFVMFSRMFVDALDSELYDQCGCCFFGLRKDCKCRMLEFVINVWAYHSGRRMVYVNPKTGIMNEQHKLGTRRSIMWVRWFHSTTLNKYELLTFEEHIGSPLKHWLWASTGQVVRQDVL